MVSKLKLKAVMKPPSRLQTSIKNLPNSKLILKQRPRPLTERTVGRSDMTQKDWVDVSDKSDSRIALARANTDRNVAIVQQQTDSIITDKTSDKMGSWLSRSLPSKDKIKEVLAPSNIKAGISSLGSSIGSGWKTARSGIKSGLGSTRNVIKSTTKGLRSGLKDVKGLARDTNELLREGAGIANIVMGGFSYLTGKPQEPSIREHTQVPTQVEEVQEEVEDVDTLMQNLVAYRASKIQMALDGSSITYASGYTSEDAGYSSVIPDMDENDRTYVENIYQQYGYPPHATEQSAILLLAQLFISDMANGQSTEDKNIVLNFNKPAELLPASMDYIIFAILGCSQIRSYDEPAPHVDTSNGESIQFVTYADDRTKQLNCSIIWR